MKNTLHKDFIMVALGTCYAGNVLIGQTSRGICCILLGDTPDDLWQQFDKVYDRTQIIESDDAFLEDAATIIEFIEHQTLLNIPLDTQGTAFQQKVWTALKTIPLGETLSYSQLAEKIGNPKAVRAVASACANNLLAIAIPCHRIIAKNGAAVGYRWGLERKKKILEIEALHM